MNALIILVTCLSFIVSFIPASAENLSGGTLSGRFLLSSGVPMSKGSVLVFDCNNLPMPMMGKYWKIPDLSVDTDNKGRFSIMLPDGKYYIAAIQRKSGQRLGPPEVGDYFYTGLDLKRNYKTYIVSNGKVTSIGTVKGIATLKAADLDFNGVITGIEGIVRDEEGKPLAQALVVAYDNPQMQGPPKFSALRTGLNGKYLLGVHQGGTFYLRVRGTYGGGKPQNGEILGAYGTMEAPLPVQVESERITKGIDIKAEKFSGRAISK